MARNHSGYNGYKFYIEKMNDITIVIIRCSGLSGATWFNLVLGSHQQTMSIGPVTRLKDLNLLSKDEACFIHRHKCSLWPGFLSAGSHQGTFYKDLAEYTGKNIFIINYPPKEYIKREIENKGFKILHVRLSRDGRACLHSHLRHYGEKTPNETLNKIVEWQIPKWDQVDRKMPSDRTQQINIRYEDAVMHPHKVLGQVGQFLGIEYTKDAHHFWKYEHHLTAGNTGVVDLLCQMQGYEGYQHRRSEYYKEYTKKLKKDPDYQCLDQSWVEELTEYDKLAFDFLLGARNAKLGYGRDNFSPDKVEQFQLFLEKEKDEIAGN